MKRALITALLAGASLTAPVIPVDAQFHYAYYVKAQPEITELVPASATSSAFTRVKHVAVPKDIYRTVLVTPDGGTYEQDISATEYRRLGEKDGARFNPKRVNLSVINLLTPRADAAIAFATTTDLTQTTATSLTYQLETTGTNRFMVTGVRTTGAVDNVKYNGTLETQGAFSNGSGGTGINNYLFFLPAPASGANNVVVTMTSSVDIATASWQFTGAQQCGSADASGTAVASAANSVTLNITTVADNAWLAAYGDNGGGGYSAGAGTIVRNPIGGGNSKYGIDSNSAKTPAGADSLILTSAGTQNWTVAGISFAPVEAVVCASAATFNPYYFTDF